MKKKLIRPLEIVLDVFGKEDILVRNKLLVEVEITECFFMKGLWKKATEHEWEIGEWELIAFYFMLKIGK